MTTTAERFDRLEFRNDAGGPRHYLCDKPVYCGTRLEVYRGNGRWEPVRYEWTGVKGEAPTIYFEPSYSERVQYYTVFRWPTNLTRSSREPSQAPTSVIGEAWGRFRDSERFEETVGYAHIAGAKPAFAEGFRLGVEFAVQRRRSPSLDEALNSGDGAYRP